MNHDVVVVVMKIRPKKLSKFLHPMTKIFLRGNFNDLELGIDLVGLN